MKNRHKAKGKASGGGVTDTDPMPADAGGEPAVKKEAKAKAVGPIDGGIAPRRLDRARGGRVGADKSPLSASSSKHPTTSAGKC